MVIAATIQRWPRWKKYNHTAWPTPEVQQRYAGLGCSMRGDLWVALLGPTVEKGIVGIGPSVQAALRAFDAQYFSLLRPATEATKIRGSGYRAFNRAAQIQPGRC